MQPGHRGGMNELGNVRNWDVSPSSKPTKYIFAIGITRNSPGRILPGKYKPASFWKPIGSVEFVHDYSLLFHY